MSDLTIEVYEKAVELAKTDSFLNEALRRLEKLNIECELKRRAWEDAKIKYNNMEQSISDEMKERH